MKSLLELATSPDKLFIDKSWSDRARDIYPDILIQRRASFRKWWLKNKEKHRERQRRWTEEALIKVANGTYNPRKSKNENK